LPVRLTFPHSFVTGFCALMLLCAPRAASAHDFWIQPTSFWLLSGSGTAMTLEVGHGPDRQRSALPLRRITRFGAVTPAGDTVDLRGALTLGGANADGALSFSAPGAYVVALETDAGAQSHLPADRFNAYAEDEGLEPALTARARYGLGRADATERYSRRAKAIVQVGAPSAALQDQVTRPIGLLLEIVPEVSPYAAAPGDTLPVRVFYEGKPLASALVKLTDLARDATPMETHRTDAAGRAVFSVPRSGSWLLNVVWTKPLRGEAVDFETVFSSISFGFPPAQPRAPAGRLGLAPERGGRAAIGLAEGGAEMTVAGEAEVEAQGGKIGMAVQQIEGARQP
jgi:uncharacterized GH25 family protein